eukprot:m.261847 g.261847  ORF g.261847 m.261847 type:complete len:530 (-) comp15581_c0_seq4:595-2184(-)
MEHGHRALDEFDWRGTVRKALCKRDNFSLRMGKTMMLSVNVYITPSSASSRKDDRFDWFNAHDGTQRLKELLRQSLLEQTQDGTFGSKPFRQFNNEDEELCAFAELAEAYLRPLVSVPSSRPTIKESLLQQRSRHGATFLRVDSRRLVVMCYPRHAVYNPIAYTTGDGQTTPHTDASEFKVTLFQPLTHHQRQQSKDGSLPLVDTAATKQRLESKRSAITAAAATTDAAGSDADGSDNLVGSVMSRTKSTSDAHMKGGRARDNATMDTPASCVTASVSSSSIKELPQTRTATGVTESSASTVDVTMERRGKEARSVNEGKEAKSKRSKLLLDETESSDDGDDSVDASKRALLPMLQLSQSSGSVALSPQEVRTKIQEVSQKRLRFLVASFMSELKDIFKGKRHSSRHEAYKDKHKRKMLKFEQRFGCFTEEQKSTIHTKVYNVFCAKSSKYMSYASDVIVPEAMVRIYREVLEVSLSQAERLLRETSSTDSHAASATAAAGSGSVHATTPSTPLTSDAAADTVLLSPQH